MPSARLSTHPEVTAQGGIASNYAQHARARPERIALIADGHVMSWQELHEHVERIAAALAARTKPSARVALHLPQGLHLALLFLGCARAGREALILDAQWPQALIEATLQRITPDLIITTLHHQALRPTDIVLPRRQPGMDEFIASLGVDAGGKAARGKVSRGIDFEVDSDTPFYIALTSGSTGVPKACRRTHGSWVASFQADAIEFGIDTDDIILAPGSLTHSLFVYALIHGLYRGAAVILCSRFRPNDVIKLAREHGATVLYGVPTQIRMILDHARARGASPLKDVRWILATGAKWFGAGKDETRDIFPHAQFVEFYGASETSFITLAKAGEGVPQGSVGRAFPGVTVTIRDANGAVLPVHERGRVFVESEMLFSGYAGMTDNQLSVADPNFQRAGRAISTGDIGYMDAQGFLFLVGRASRMIVTSGKNLYPEEVEMVLMRHPLIEQAALFATSDNLRGEKIVAALRLRPAQQERGGKTLTRRMAIAYLRAHVPLFQVPRHYVVVRDWPLTPSGKTDFQSIERNWREGAYEVLN